MKIAIIGSGISGLSAAYFLNKKHDITIYEKNSYIGGHARTLEIDYEGTKIAVDTGFIVFNYRNYFHLTNLFKELNVEVEKSDMSFGISINKGEIEWSAQSLISLFGQPSNLFNPKFYRMLFDMRKFFKNAALILNEDKKIPLGEFLEELKIGEEFKEWFLLPMGAAIWSCPLATMMQFPAKSFVRFFENHGLLTITDQPQWFTVKGGSKNYVKKISENFSNKILTNCAATKIKRLDDKIEIIDSQGNKKTYDKIIFACHGDEALSMLEDASNEEKEILSAFKYQENVAYLHRDQSLMPKRKRCWASWIYLKENDDIKNNLAVSYWMNNLQNIDKKKPLFITLNPPYAPSSDLVFDRHIFYHPIFTQEAIDAQEKITQIQGQNNTYFCGAHLRYGFHEDGILSAVNIAKKLEVKIPWE